jgi:hypothetical protein
MCLLAFLSPGVQPDRKALECSCFNNPDGFGFAILTGPNPGDTIIRGHSMDSDALIDSFIAAREAYPNYGAMFHARWATHGAVNESNCHPFPVAGRDDLLMGHNGILSCTPTAKDPRSDTRLFADEILMRRFRHLDSRKTRKRLESWLGGSKLVILTTDPFYQHNTYIFNEDQGDWVEGIWYSNDSYRLARTVYTWPKATKGITGGYSESSEDWDRYRGDYAKICSDCLEYDQDCRCGGLQRVWTWTGAKPKDDEDFGDPRTWVCKDCRAAGSIDPDTAQCDWCDFYWCCDSTVCACGYQADAKEAEWADLREEIAASVTGRELEIHRQPGV